MWRAADDLAGWPAACVEEGPQPAEASQGKVGREGLGQGNEIQGFAAIGTLAGAIVERLRDRAARTAPRREPAAPASGEVALGAGRRPHFGKEAKLPTIGTTHFFATILAGLARERSDRGEPLIQFIEAEAGCLRERMPGTADAMRTACDEARRMRGRAVAAE